MPQNKEIASGMNSSPSREWVEKMNQLGKEGIPFLFVLDFDGKEPVVVPIAELSTLGLRFQFPELSSPEPIEFLYPEIELKSRPVSFDQYEISFQKVMQAIQNGDTYLLNLTYATPVEGVASLHQVYYIASARYKLYYPGRFVVFSPEQFVSISHGMIRTFPMKGTIDANIPDAESILLNDRKEQEEHATVVDLLRNDLSIVAEKVKVEQYRFISKVRTRGKTLLQTSTEISGQLPADYQQHLGDIFHVLLPAGSVTGAPKKRTVELIRQIEPEARGYYTGVFGVFDGKDLESAVMIRMIEQRDDGYYYRSGGGITYQSDARAEYQEMIDKIYIPI